MFIKQILVGSFTWWVPSSANIIPNCSKITKCHFYTWQQHWYPKRSIQTSCFLLLVDFQDSIFRARSFQVQWRHVQRRLNGFIVFLAFWLIRLQNLVIYLKMFKWPFLWKIFLGLVEFCYWAISTSPKGPVFQTSLNFKHLHPSFCLKLKIQKEGEKDRALKPWGARGIENPVCAWLHAFGLVGQRSFSHWWKC